MNENQARRKAQDRMASLRDYSMGHNPNMHDPIKQEAARVNAATQEERADIGPQDMHPNAVRW